MHTLAAYKYSCKRLFKGNMDKKEKRMDQIRDLSEVFFDYLNENNIPFEISVDSFITCLMSVCLQQELCIHEFSNLLLKAQTRYLKVKPECKDLI